MTPLPSGLRIVLDPSVRSLGNGDRLLGGHPMRFIRLTDAGREALDRLLAGRDTSVAARRLGRRLVDAGMAHPRPPTAGPAHVPTEQPSAALRPGRVHPDEYTVRQPSVDATVVVPARDRPGSLDACLAALGTSIPVVVVDDGSDDPAAVADVCRRRGAKLVVRSTSGGPAAARNDALVDIATELVAFVDSDCVPPPGWLALLAGYFADPLVGAVAPRIRPAPAGTSPPWRGRRGPVARDRYSASRSPLDMGSAEGEVGPGRPVAYVPSATLVVRRSALDGGLGFDPALRYGEDVDLVWRLRDAGWRVRYVPSVVVTHDEPKTWPALLARRFRYGTSAAPLSQRHGQRLAPAVLAPLPTVAALLLLARQPWSAAAVTGASAVALWRRLGHTGLPPVLAIRWTVRSIAETTIGLGRAGTILAGGVLLAVAVGHPATGSRWDGGHGRDGNAVVGGRHGRWAAIVLLAAPPLVDWWRRRPELDQLRWTVASVADDTAYGAGVWWGCLRLRTMAPLIPAFGTAAGPVPDQPTR